MKRICCAMLAFAFLIPAGLAALGVTAGDPTTVSAADKKKIRTQVTGTGKTSSEAENAAEKAARDVAGGGGSTYQTIDRKTSGSGTNWTCTIIIEYTPK